MIAIIIIIITTKTKTTTTIEHASNPNQFRYLPITAASIWIGHGSQRIVGSASSGTCRYTTSHWTASNSAASIRTGDLPARIEPLEFAPIEFGCLAECFKLQTARLFEDQLFLLQQLERRLVDHGLKIVHFGFWWLLMFRWFEVSIYIYHEI